MPSTKIRIFNLALSRIGTKSSVKDPDERSVEAQRCRDVYDHVRKTVLRDHEWNFATVYVSLALVGDGTTNNRWTYKYRYPTSCLNAIAIEKDSDVEDDVPFEVALDNDTGVRVIYTDREDAVMKFIYDVENTALFDDSFVDAMGWKMAREVAPGLSNLTVAQEMERGYQLYLSIAKGINNEEGQPKEPREPSSVRARL